MNVNHTTELTKKIFEVTVDAVISVCDGTYKYIQKHFKFNISQETYSMHKNRNILKMMMIVIKTGHIIACFGSYLANWNNNDAKITGEIMKDQNEKKFFQRRQYFCGR